MSSDEHQLGYYKISCGDKTIAIRASTLEKALLASLYAIESSGLRAFVSEENVFEYYERNIQCTVTCDGEPIARFGSEQTER